MVPSKEEHQMVHVYKPNFVPGKSRAAIICLAAPLLTRSSGLPEVNQGEQPCLRENPSDILLLDLAPSGVCRVPQSGIPFIAGPSMLPSAR